MRSDSPNMRGALAMALAAALPVWASIENPSILPTPPMGFNDWARFECNINETLFVETADAMASNGLLDAGYNRINLDDCWLTHERSANGSLQWNETLFPRGLIWLGDYVHKKGFHFGIYNDAGNATCGGYPGTRGHEEQDAKTFASWGVDYLKLDGCNVFPFKEQTYQNIYSKWHEVLTSLEHPMIFSESAPAYFSNDKNLTDWYEVMDWVPQYGELARHSTDIAVYGLYAKSHYWKSVMTNYGYEVLVARFQQPGYYNDPDFLISGFPYLTLDEKKSQFALWSSFSAPLIISSYIPDLTKAELEFLTNKDIIAVDQDAMAQQATLVSQGTTFDVLTRSLANGDRLLTVLNKGEETNSTVVSLARMGLPSSGKYTAKDLWTGDEHAVSNQDGMTVSLASHATAIYRISGVKSVTPTGMIFNTASKLCMAATKKSGINFTPCVGSDEQVWMVSEQGAISPLSATEQCLSASKKGGVSLVKCGSDAAQQKWVYHVTGNVVNKASGLCLNQKGPDHVTTCGFEMNQQVFGLPAGVEVIRGKVV